MSTVVDVRFGSLPYKKHQIKSLEFVLTNSFMKIFQTKSKDVVTECMLFFEFPSIVTAIDKRKEKFLRKLIVSHAFNNVCCIFIASAKTELVEVRARLRKVD